MAHRKIKVRLSDGNSITVSCRAINARRWVDFLKHRFPNYVAVKVVKVTDHSHIHKSSSRGRRTTPAYIRSY